MSFRADLEKKLLEPILSNQIKDPSFSMSPSSSPSKFWFGSGGDLNSTVTDEVLLNAMGSKSLKSTSMEELLTLQDGTKTHIGHDLAKSKGGEPVLSNLEPQDQHYNQSQGNK